MKHMNKSETDIVDVNTVKDNQWKKHYKQLCHDDNYDMI